MRAEHRQVVLERGDRLDYDSQIVACGGETTNFGNDEWKQVTCGLKTLADVIHPFPAFNRVLGGSLHELAAKASNKAPHDPDVIHHNQWRSQ